MPNYRHSLVATACSLFPYFQRSFCRINIRVAAILAVTTVSVCGASHSLHAQAAKLDTSFNASAGVNGDIHTGAVQADGKIVIGG